MDPERLDLSGVSGRQLAIWVSSPDLDETVGTRISILPLPLLPSRDKTSITFSAATPMISTGRGVACDASVHVP